MDHLGTGRDGCVALPTARDHSEQADNDRECPGQPHQGWLPLMGWVACGPSQQILILPQVVVNAGSRNEIA